MKSIKILAVLLLVASNVFLIVQNFALKNQRNYWIKRDQDWDKASKNLAREVQKLLESTESIAAESKHWEDACHYQERRADDWEKDGIYLNGKIIHLRAMLDECRTNQPAQKGERQK